MMSPEEKLGSLGLVLPETPKPHSAPQTGLIIKARDFLTTVVPQ